MGENCGGSKRASFLIRDFLQLETIIIVSAAEATQNPPIPFQCAAPLPFVPINPRKKQWTSSVRNIILKNLSQTWTRSREARMNKIRIVEEVINVSK